MNTNVWQLRLLARRHPFCAWCFALIVPLCIASMVLSQMQESLGIRQRASQAQGEAVLAALVSGQPLRQELAAARQTTRKIQDNLVSETSLAENLWYFYKIEEQTKAHIDDLRPLNAITSDLSGLYKKVPFGLRVSGSTAQVLDFILAVETGPRLANITTLRLARRAGNAAVLGADMNLDLLAKK